MASYTSFQIVKSVLAFNWTHTPIRSPLEGDTVPRDLTEFAEITFPYSEETQISIGAPGTNVFRETGAFHFCILIPFGEVITTWLQRVDELRDALRNYRSIDGNFRIYEAPPPVMDDKSDREGYYELSVAVPYELDIYK